MFNVTIHFRGNQLYTHIRKLLMLIIETMQFVSVVYTSLMAAPGSLTFPF